jgi:hypothetical protein
LGGRQQAGQLFFDISYDVGGTKSPQHHTCIIMGGRRKAGQLNKTTEARRTHRYN